MALQIRSVAVILLWGLTLSSGWSQDAVPVPPAQRHPTAPARIPGKPELAIVPPAQTIPQIPLSSPATAEQVAEWVRKLDSNVFSERESATIFLAQAGESSLEQVSGLFSGRSLEVTLRALHVLRTIALCGDEATEDKAQAALEKIAERRDTPVSRRADIVLASIAETRQSRTIESLQRLGARFSSTTSPFGVQLDDDVSEVEIGVDWTGEEKDLRRLRWLSDIHKVTFSGAQVNDRWLKAIGGMQNVGELKVKHAKVTDAGIAYVKDLPKLQRLKLLYVPLSDASIQHLVGLKSLVRLDLYGTEITIAGAQRIRNDLEFLELDFRHGGFLGIGGQDHLLGYQIFRVQENSAAANAKIEVEDILIKFGDEKIRSFVELTNRISKNRAGETVTLTIARNTNTRTLQIVHNVDEILGVATRPNVIGLEITGVEAKSVADQSGLRAGDIVVAYKKIRLTDLEQWKELFAANQPGHVYELEFVRNAQILKIPVTLGEWD